MSSIEAMERAKERYKEICVALSTENDGLKRLALEVAWRRKRAELQDLGVSASDLELIKDQAIELAKQIVPVNQVPSLGLIGHELEDFQLSVAPFSDIYRHVTYFMRRHWRSLGRTGRTAEARWLAFLIAHFRSLYRKWPEEPLLSDYLRIFIGRNRPWLVRLSGFVFLHISHDLPIVIARSLVPLNNNPPQIQRNQGRVLYLDLNLLFFDAFLRAARSGNLGLRARFSSYLPGARQATKLLAQWALALRGIAWIHGEILHDLGGPQPAHLEKLRAAVTEAAETAARRYWILGLPIHPPTPRFLLLGFLPAALDARLFGIIFASVLIISGISAYFWFKLQSRFLECLAREIQVQLEKWRQGILKEKSSEEGRAE